MKSFLLLASMMTTFSLADVIGGEINFGYFSHVSTGTLQYEGDVIDVKETLKWENEVDMFAKVYIEHPLPIIPNIKLGYSDFGHTGAGMPAQSFEFAGTTYAVNSNVDSNFDLKMYDLTFYYELLDNWVNLDVGVNVKYIDGLISIRNDRGISESTDFQTPMPMLYAKARFDVPTTDVSFQVEGNYLSYDGHEVYDAEAGLRYTFLLGLGVEAGYKIMKLKLDNVDDLSMDSDFSGAYGKLVWDF